MENGVLLAWSGGKDSALTLHELHQKKNIEIAALLTTITEGYDRVSMHGIRRSLLMKQANALGYPLEEIAIPQNCTNEVYEQQMLKTLEKYRQKGISKAAFGDLFLEEVRAYREERMSRVGMRCIFPLWGKSTADLARQFVRLGYRAVVVCVDTGVLGREFAGREYNEDFIKDLPPRVDPCGENGEFHTFVYDGPIFVQSVVAQRGEKALRDNRFYFCDLIDYVPSMSNRIKPT
jgi:uncharacterized protein (TIGR00290 family)